MSASSKKKIRKEQEAEKLTEKQLTAQKEEKKVRTLTTVFVICMAAILVVALFFGIRQTITANGTMEKKTTALTVGEHKISGAELNYFYIDTVNNFMSTYGSYAAMFGLDTSKALDEQAFNPETGETWADYLLGSAESSAKSNYALADAAKEAGYTLSDNAKASVDAVINSMDAYGAMSGYGDGKAYLKAMYGNGASMDSYRAYLEQSFLAEEYRDFYTNGLTYTDDQIRAAESENFDQYSSYSFNYYYLSATRFLEGGTEGENGTTYTDEEKAASVKAAEAAANEVMDAEIASVADLDAAIAALSINEGQTASSTASENMLYSSISSAYAEWVTDSARKEGDLTIIPNTNTSVGEDGKETTTTSGYYLVYFVGKNDNQFAMSNVRHILVAFEGGTTDSTTNVTTYSDEEKAAAKEEAEAILAEWKSGAATEDSFAELANAKSDDGNGTTGGLYENITADSNFVVNFKNWALEDHKAGDTGIVETEYGYHVMYYCGDSAITYRDYMIENDLRSADAQQWYQNLLEPMEMTEGDTSFVRKHLTLGNAG